MPSIPTINLYEDGELRIVNETDKQRYLDLGWTLTPERKRKPKPEAAPAPAGGEG